VAGDELFKRYLEIGASVLTMSRERAESIVRDLVASGEVARSQAGKAADWLVERGRAGTEELAELVRREIREQVAALGLATKDDLARLEARLEEVKASAANAATPTAAAAAVPRTAKANPAVPRTAKAAPAAPAPAGDAAEETTAGTGKAGAGRSTKTAGISRSASVGKRGARPPAGGATSAKG
jgi:polyhydroxyalkanoate synthesis regulator phasin